MDERTEVVAEHMSSIAQLPEPIVTSAPNLSEASCKPAAQPVTCTPKREMCFSPVENVAAVAVAPTSTLLLGPPRSIHIPYILNGELFSIQTQEGENVTVKCCHCPPDRVYRGSVRSTGNFHMHIKRRHPDLLGKLHEMKVCALLERRDRFMKNRKYPHRGGRRTATVAEKRPGRLERHTPASPGALMHTHKLKIKTVFQRHKLQQLQQQQQQQELKTQLQEQHDGMCDWDSAGVNALAPTTTHGADATTMQAMSAELEEEQQQPINYSLKQYADLMVADFADNNNGGDMQSRCVEFVTGTAATNVQMAQNASVALEQHASEGLTEWCKNTGRSSSNTPTNITNSFQLYHLHPTAEAVYEHNNALRSATHAAVSTCPSTVSSFGSQLSVRSESPAAVVYNPINVDHEQYYAAEQPVDLSKQPSGASSGFASASTSLITARHSRDAFDVYNFNANGGANSKRDELLLAMVHSLQDIRNVLQTRNELSNRRNELSAKRLCLEMAKFKYLHPNFTFQN